MALWTPSSSGCVFEHHTIVDLATSIVNHKTGTNTASVNGSWTGAAGYQDVSGTGPKGLNFGVGVTEDVVTLATIYDPNSGCCILGTSGTNPALPARARLWLDAQPALGLLCTINGQAITVVASGATGFQINLGASLWATAFNLATLINANGGTFAMTAYNGQQDINGVIELTSIATGTAPNSITLATSQTQCRFTARNGLTTVGVLGSGAAGVAVTSGLYHSGTVIQARNSAQGVGGLAEITVPGTAGYYYIEAILEKGNFAQLRLYAGGVLASISDRRVSDGSRTSGRVREASGNLFSGLTGGGTGNGKMTAAGKWSRGFGLAEGLANYLAWQAAALADAGVTVN